MDTHSSSHASLEARIAELERRMLALEMTPSANSTKSEGDPDPRSVTGDTIPVAPDARVLVFLVRKSFHKADLMAGDAGDRIELSLRFNSQLPRDARAFKGAIVFQDLFSEIILSVALTHESGLKAGGVALWDGGILYNQFLPSHQRLLSTLEKDLITTFNLEAVVYLDGTSERFPT